MDAEEAALQCNRLGCELKKQDKCAEALAQFEQAVKYCPKFSAAHMNRGNALLNLGRITEALEAYRTSIRLYEKRPLVHYNYGRALGIIKCYREATMELQRAVELDPTDIRIQATCAKFAACARMFWKGYRHAFLAIRLRPLLKDGYVALTYVFLLMCLNVVLILAGKNPAEV